MDSFDLVDGYFGKISDSPQDQLDSKSHTLVEVWHSFALIQNSGFHGYLCSIGNLARNIANHYRSAELFHAADLISEATDLWYRYWPTNDPEDSCPDDFRKQFGDQLDIIESKFYSFDDEVAEKLAKLIPTSE